MTHVARVPYFELSPRLAKTLVGMSGNIRRDLLGARLVELVFMRVSQVNGCGFCVDMHWTELIRLGTDPRHVNAVSAWPEAPFFSERERAALRWAEIVTSIPHSDASDAEFAALKGQFSDEEIAELGFAISIITSWNLLNVSLRNPIPATA
ncbi:carboxymuconolactone decarboxylase family protein [soil metagenome]